MEWINVEDQLPENDDDVLIIGSKRAQREYCEHMMIAWYTPGTGKWSSDRYTDIEDNHDMWWISHWMPLPEIPPIDTPSGEQQVE